MKQLDFEGMCELFQEGRLTWVENKDTHQAGRVISCAENAIEVDVSGNREKWDWRACQEMTHGYKVKYEEVKKHPHEFDTHGD
jgi:hypothetical protein